MFQPIERQAQILQQPVLQIINKSMYPQLPSLLPRLLDNRYPGYIVDLLPHVELAQQVHVFLLSRQD